MALKERQQHLVWTGATKRKGGLLGIRLGGDPHSPRRSIEKQRDQCCAAGWKLLSNNRAVIQHAQRVEQCRMRSGWRQWLRLSHTLPLDRSRRQLAITLLNRWPQAERRRELQRRFHRWAAFLSKARARETQTRHDARQAELAQLALRLLIRWAQASIRRRLLNFFARWTDFLANARARERETRSDVRERELIALWQLHSARHEQESEESQATQICILSLRNIYRRSFIRVQRARLARAIKLWIAIVERFGERRRAQQRWILHASQRIAKQTLAKGWRTWLHQCQKMARADEKRERQRALMARFCQRLLLRWTAAAWRTWTQALVLLDEAEQRRCRSEAARKHRTAAQQSAVSRAVRRLKDHILLQALRRWDHVVILAVVKEKEAWSAVKRTLLRLVRAATFSAFKAWIRFDASMSRCQERRRAQQRWILHASQRIAKQTLAKGWRTWLHQCQKMARADEKRERQRALMARFCQRLLLRWTAAAWRTWIYFFKNMQRAEENRRLNEYAEVMRRAVLRHTIRRMVKQVVRNSFRFWDRYVQSLAWAKYIFSHKQTMLRRILCREALRYVQLAWRSWLKKFRLQLALLQAERDKKIARSEQKAIIRRIFRRIIQRACSGTWRRWLLWTKHDETMSASVSGGQSEPLNYEGLSDVPGGAPAVDATDQDEDALKVKFLLCSSDVDLEEDEEEEEEQEAN